MHGLTTIAAMPAGAGHLASVKAEDMATALKASPRTDYFQPGTVVIRINVDGSVDKRTQAQIAAAAAGWREHYRGEPRIGL